MISSHRLKVAIYKESHDFRREDATEYILGIRRGLDIALQQVVALDEEAKRNCDDSPFVWKASMIRKMLKQAIAYLLRCDRARGIALIEKVLTIQKGGLR